jgi:hypothetical protein
VTLTLDEYVEGAIMERNIKFQYFKMDYQERDDGTWRDAGEFDFISWIDFVDEYQLEKATIELKDTKARLEKIKFFKDHNVWVTRFMKLRDENLPYIAKEHEEAEDIPLDPDEYIGEDMYMLYDINTRIAMIQSNRFSLGLVRLAEFLIKSQNKENARIRLFPIEDKVDLKSFRRNMYRTIELGFANITRDVSSNKSALGDILGTYKKFAGVSGTIKISIGRAKDDSLDVVEVDKLISELSECKNITSAKVKVRDDDLSKVEVVDLLEETFSNIITFKIPPRETLGFDYAASNMISCYAKVKDKIVKLISIPE